MVSTEKKVYPSTSGSEPGLTLKEYYAGQALIGLLSYSSKTNNYDPYIVIRAIAIAEQMCKNL